MNISSCPGDTNDDILYRGVGCESSSGENAAGDSVKLSSPFTDTDSDLRVGSSSKSSGSSYDDRSGDGDGGRGGKLSVTLGEVGWDLMAVCDDEREWVREKLVGMMSSGYASG